MAPPGASAASCSTSGRHTQQHGIPGPDRPVVTCPEIAAAPTARLPTTDPASGSPSVPRGPIDLLRQAPCPTCDQAGRVRLAHPVGPVVGAFGAARRASRSTENSASRAPSMSVALARSYWPVGQEEVRATTSLSTADAPHTSPGRPSRSAVIAHHRGRPRVLPAAPSGERILIVRVPPLLRWRLFARRSRLLVRC
jgi:hypothetical protein